MFDAVINAIAALQSEAAGYPDGVQIWMRVMALSFFCGIVFLPWKSEARWIVAVMALTAIGLVLAKILLPEVNRTAAGTVLHLALWPVALGAVWQKAARENRRRDAPSALQWIYSAWLIWVSVLIVISLVLDALTLVRTMIAFGL